jgi:hypothetical protein
MAVLYRFNAQSEAWETAFADAGIPYRVAGDPYSRKSGDGEIAAMAVGAALSTRARASKTAPGPAPARSSATRCASTSTTASRS